MGNNNVAQTVVRIIARQLNRPVEEITLDSHLESELGADSLDFTEIFMKVEEEFNITIEDEKITINLSDMIVQDIIRLIQNKI